MKELLHASRDHRRDLRLRKNLEHYQRAQLESPGNHRYDQRILKIRNEIAILAKLNSEG